MVQKICMVIIVEEKRPLFATYTLIYLQTTHSGVCIETQASNRRQSGEPRWGVVPCSRAVPFS